jgi:hypothetical protein
MRSRSGFPIALLSAVATLTLVGRGTGQEQGKQQSFRLHEPGWVLAGMPTVVKLYGQDLNPSEIRFEQPGIRAKILKVGAFSGQTDVQKRWGNTVVEAEVSIPASSRPGNYRFTLVGEGVQDASGALCVDTPAPEIPEVEPNNDLRKPQVLPPGPVTVIGKLDNEGADVFRFDGKAGETWRVEVYAHRLNRETRFEPILRLRDPRMAPVRAAVHQGNDCHIEYHLPMDGPYLVELFDADNRSGGDFNYRLALRRY